jgi:Methyltransferase domain
VAGDAVPALGRSASRPALLTPAARKAIRQRMMLLRSAATDRLSRLTGTPVAELVRLHREIRDGGLPDTLLLRGAGLPFTRELPQGPLLYILVRATRPRRIVETGVGPGYSTAWMLAALDANGSGELVSLGPGTPNGRPSLNGNTSIGQFVPPSLRSRWTLALGNTEDRLREILAQSAGVDLFFYDNGPSAARARFELRSAWDALSERGILLAHHVDANPAWADFCHLQGLPPQLLDPGPPPLGGLAVRAPGA